MMYLNNLVNYEQERIMEQIKMIIIDDEPIILRGMVETYPWNEMGFYIVGTATSAESGLSLIKEKKPKVVLSDIRMNRMSGLTLVEKVKELDENIHFILMSAYKEFEYAQKACETGVFAYLIKPIEEELLRKTMKSMYEQCEKEEQMADEHDCIKEILTENKEEFQNAMMERYLKEEIDERSFIRRLEMVGTSIGAKNGFMSICVGLGENYHSMNAQEFEAQGFAVFNYIKQRMLSLYKGWWFKEGIDKMVFIIEIRDERELEKAHLVIKQLIDEGAKITHTVLCSSLSFLFYGIEGLVESYKQVQAFYSVEKSKKNLSDSIAKALNYIEDHLVDEDLSITSVSECVYLNPVYFGRLFKNTMGISFKQYVINKRIELAKKKIIEESSSIVTIGNEVGIPNSSYFAQVFKKITGYLPSEYKKEITNGQNE